MCLDDIAWDSEIGVCRESLFSAMTDTRRRVKLYALNADRQWDDRGTGHVSSSYVDRLKGISLLVRAESDGEFMYLFVSFTRSIHSVSSY